MAEIADVKTYHGELSGEVKLYQFTCTIGSASDTVILTAAGDGVASIVGIVGVAFTGTLDAAYTIMKVTYSGLTLTFTGLKADGATPADEFTAITATVTLLVKSTA
jgi:hypothetical protein